MMEFLTILPIKKNCLTLFNNLWILNRVLPYSRYKSQKIVKYLSKMLIKIVIKTIFFD